MSEKLCLQWNDFRENAVNTFESLKEDKDFTDVTLVCEDGKQVEAHKVILANSSPFFQNIHFSAPINLCLSSSHFFVFPF